MNSRLKQTIGLRIRSARRSAGLTQEQVAAQIARTPESISNIERGQQLPNLETLAELARILKVPIAEFFEGAEHSSIPRKRLQMEMHIRQITRELNNRDLAVAVRQIEAFLPSK